MISGVSNPLSAEDAVASGNMISKLEGNVRKISGVTLAVAGVTSYFLNLLPYHLIVTVVASGLGVYNTGRW